MPRRNHLALVPPLQLPQTHSRDVSYLARRIGPLGDLCFGTAFARFKHEGGYPFFGFPRILPIVLDLKGKSIAPPVLERTRIIRRRRTTRFRADLVARCASPASRFSVRWIGCVLPQLAKDRWLARPADDPAIIPPERCAVPRSQQLQSYLFQHFPSSAFDTPFPRSLYSIVKVQSEVGAGVLSRTDRAAFNRCHQIILKSTSQCWCKY